MEYTTILARTVLENQDVDDDDDASGLLYKYDMLHIWEIKCVGNTKRSDCKIWINSSYVAGLSLACGANSLNVLCAAMLTYMPKCIVFTHYFSSLVNYSHGWAFYYAVNSPGICSI